MQPPIAFGQRNWLEYRARYLDEARVQSGAAFVRNHQAAMQRAQRSSGCRPKSSQQSSASRPISAASRATFARSMR